MYFRESKKGKGKEFTSISNDCEWGLGFRGWRGWRLVLPNEKVTPRRGRKMVGERKRRKRDTTIEKPRSGGKRDPKFQKKKERFLSSKHLEQRYRRSQNSPPQVRCDRLPEKGKPEERSRLTAGTKVVRRKVRLQHKRHSEGAAEGA